MQAIRLLTQGVCDTKFTNSCFIKDYGMLQVASIIGGEKSSLQKGHSHSFQ